MLKKTITYTDYDGNERTEDYYFNLSKAELLEMEMSTNGGLEKFCQKIIAEKDTKRMMEMWKELILKSYGEKSLDGKRFIKNQELVDSFTQTEAYSELFMELASNADTAAAFVKGIIPKNLLAQIEKEKLTDTPAKAFITENVQAVANA
jgi:hypothetical protein